MGYTYRPFPEPDDCPKMKGVFLESPKPPGALDNVMEVIIGDGSPLVIYVCVYLLP